MAGRWRTSVATVVVLAATGAGCSGNGSSTEGSESDCPPLVQTGEGPPPTHSAECAVVHDPPETGIARPAVVRPGEFVAITPASPIDPWCADIAVVLRFDTDGYARVGVITPDGSWRQFGAEPHLTIPGCTRSSTEDAVSYRLPEDIEPGVVRICRAVFDLDAELDPRDSAVAAGCADVTVERG